MDLSENAITVLKARYLKRDPATGAPCESPEDLFRRVAQAVAQAELKWGGSPADCAADFFAAMTSLEFLPNSPCLMNAGRPLGMLSACFVLPVEDSMEGIFDSLKLMALIEQSGGGVGFAFSRLRPRGDRVASTDGSASGPISFMKIFDSATENIKQGGKRRGANMAVLSVDHPDIGLFVDAKRDGTSFRNFNFSVGVSDEFMKAVADDRRWALRHPRTRQATREVSAAELFNQIAHAAWQTGDPGLLFLDTINRDNPTPAIGAIEATNPCGEVPLLPFESCNLASINLSRMIRATAAGFEIDWQKLSRLVRLGIRFLDNMVEIGRWPAPQIAAITHANRKVGLGVMGFAELLTLLGIPYASEQAVSIAEQLMRHISIEADAASSELVAQRGVFPHWDRSIYAAKSMRLRNATRTSIAPTGTLSIIAGTSAGIEPLFALAYRRQALDGKTLVELNPLFLRYAQQHGFYSDALVRELSARGSLAGVDGVPEQARRLFQTALEISPETHLSIQAAFQKHTDNSVSKTINLPQDATATDVAAAYRKAWEMKLKGITVFRYGSKSEQVLQLGTGETGLQREHFVRCDPHDCKL